MYKTDRYNYETFKNHVDTLYAIHMKSDLDY